MDEHRKLAEEIYLNCTNGKHMKDRIEYALRSTAERYEKKGVE